MSTTKDQFRSLFGVHPVPWKTVKASTTEQVPAPRCAKCKTGPRCVNSTKRPMWCFKCIDRERYQSWRQKRGLK